MPPDAVQCAHLFEERVAAFESAWQVGLRPRLADFLPDIAECVEPALRRELLLELIQVDLEFRWRNGKRRGPLLEWYRKQLTELGTLDTLPLSLVDEEYRVRSRWGDVPSHSEYVARFPRGGLALTDILAGVDVALADEGLFAVKSSARRVSRSKLCEFDRDAPLSHSDFHLKRQIGSGGMSRVYTAVQVSLDKPVAVKILRKERLSDALSVQRFRREARLTAMLRGPGIVDVHGVGRLPDGGYFMVLDLISGSDLSALGVVTPHRAARIIVHLAEIVSRVHRSGVIHCDLTPGNVLVDSLENVFLTDFGLARRFAGQTAETVFDDHPAGTPAFMAPEQLDARCGEIGPWTDVYGLGGILHNLLFGRSPKGNSTDEIPVNVPAASEGNSRLPTLSAENSELSSICRGCLAQKPEDRFRTIDQLLVGFRAILEGLARSTPDTKMHG